MGLNREDDDHDCYSTSYMDAHQNSQGCGNTASMLLDIEAREERRRVFWLLYCLDRHLGLSFNSSLKVPDEVCKAYGMPPEKIKVKTRLTITYSSITGRNMG